MSALRVVLFSRHALRCSRSLSRHYAGLSATSNRFCRERTQPTQLFVQQAPARLYSKDNETPWTDVKYDELKALIKSGHVQLIDVREPEEIASTGLLPGAINIPLGRLHQALNYMSDQAFQNKYKRPQPKKWDNNILLYGQDFDSVRASAALELLHKWGFIKLHIDLKMPEEDFKEKYGVEKPGKDNLILHCLGGIRSRGALAIAHALGYEKARHYIGGYAEWAAKQQS